MICPHCSGYIKGGGPPRKLSEAQERKAAWLVDRGWKLEAIALELGVSRATVSRAARKWRER